MSSAINEAHQRVLDDLEAKVSHRDSKIFFSIHRAKYEGYSDNDFEPDDLRVFNRIFNQLKFGHRDDFELFQRKCFQDYERYRHHKQGDEESPFNINNIINDLTEVATAEPPPALFTLKDHKGKEELFIPRGKVCVLASEGGMGKSLLALHLGVSLARKTATDLRSWCGEPLTPKPRSGKVVLLYAEEDRETCLYRLRMQLSNEVGYVSPDVLRDLSGRLLPLPLCSSTSASNLALSDSYRSNESGAPERLEQLLRMLEEVAGDDGIDLIVLDPLAQFGGSDFETDNGEASRLMRNIQRLTGVKGNPTVLVIHHSAKAAKRGKLVHSLRGSSAIKDNARWAGVLRRIDENDTGDEYLKDRNDRGVIELVGVKSNYGPNFMRVRCISHASRIITAEEYLLKANRRIKTGDETLEEYVSAMLKVKGDDEDETDTPQSRASAAPSPRQKSYM